MIIMKTHYRFLYGKLLYNHINTTYTYLYTVKYKGTGGLRFSQTNGLLTSDFGSSTLGEMQFLKVFRNYTKLTKPQ